MEKIYHLLANQGITPNQHYVLWCIRDGISPGMVNIAMEMRVLTPDWIQEGKLTGKSLSLLMEIDEMNRDKKAKNDKELLGENYLAKMEHYREIFPDIKLPTGKYAREAVKNLEVGFRWFFKNHEYDWNTVFKAAEKYVNEYRDKNWEFMRTSKYFIKKQEKNGDTSSDLANYCEMVVTGGGDNDADNFHFTEKVV